MMQMRVRLVVVLLVLTMARFSAAADAPAVAPIPPAAKPGPRAAEFSRIFAQWKELLTHLGTLKVQFRTADPAKRAELANQWKELVQRAEVMEGQLITAAENAYEEAPNSDKELTDLLVGMLSFWTEKDDYERAFPLGKLLMEHKCPDERVPNYAGLAAYCVNEYDAAQSYLNQAAKLGKLTEIGRVDLDSIEYSKQAWAKEKAIREAEAKANDLPRVLLKTTKGDIELELFENEAPNAVANFISLVDKGFYNGLTFHRVLEHFMAQGGCPKGDGTGGPGYHIACECYQPNHRLHFRGTLSMAHAGRDTGGSQFFLTFVPTTHLDGKHTAFGRVVQGMDVLAKLQRRDPGDPNAPPPDKILEAKVLRKRPGTKYEPKKTEE
jgi:cyclophilin family peptidyl-prolyl cis-trans isomerase